MSYEIHNAMHIAFIKAIRDRRRKLGITQKEVAKRLKVDQSTYAGIEAGRASPTIDTVDRVAKALKFTDALDLFASHLAHS